MATQPQGQRRDLGSPQVDVDAVQLDLFGWHP